MSKAHIGRAVIALTLLVSAAGTARADRRVNELSTTVAACHRDLFMKETTPAKRQDDPGPAPKPLAEVIDLGRGTCRKTPLDMPTDGSSPVDELPIPIGQRSLQAVQLLANIRF
jgi:hypothetical protein